MKDSFIQTLAESRVYEWFKGRPQCVNTVLEETNSKFNVSKIKAKCRKIYGRQKWDQKRWKYSINVGKNASYIIFKVFSVAGFIVLAPTLLCLRCIFRCYCTIAPKIGPLQFYSNFFTAIFLQHFLQKFFHSKKYLTI